jgi:DNA-binding NarL/FixJ family response regulator
MPDGYPSRNGEITNPTGDALDAIDQAVAQISDAEVDNHLRRVLSRAAPRVFISYTHDSTHHMGAVRAFSEFLLTLSLDVHIDREVHWDWRDPDVQQDWHRWVTGQLTSSDRVLVIASPLCRSMGNGQTPSERLRSRQSELPLIQKLLQSDPAIWKAKVLPVVLPGRSADELPEFLQPQAVGAYHQVTEFTMEGTEELLSAITGQPWYRAARRIRVKSAWQIDQEAVPDGALTPMELQIVTLIADDYGNNAIAMELLISQVTVAQYVASINTKLGFTSRAQIAAWAARRHIDAGRPPTNEQY